MLKAHGIGLCISYLQGKGHCFCGPLSIYVIVLFFSLTVEILVRVWDLLIEA